MTPASSRPSQQAERDELASLLPAAVVRSALPSDRYHARKVHLMDNMNGSAPAPSRSRRFALKAVLPIGVATAAAGVAIALVPGPNAPAAWAVERQADGVVKVTLGTPGTVDVGALQADLKRKGLPARAYVADPDCHDQGGVPGVAGSGERPPADMLRTAEENGKTVAYIKPDKVPAGITLIFGSEPGFDTWQIGGVPGNPPKCLPGSKVGQTWDMPGPDGKVYKAALGSDGRLHFTGPDGRKLREEKDANGFVWLIEPDGTALHVQQFPDAARLVKR